MFIKTEKFIIRSPEKSDYHHLLKLYQKEKVMKFIPNALIDWDLKKVEDKILKFKQTTLGIHVIESCDGDFMGEGSIFMFPEDQEAYEIGFILDDSFWGNGYGSLVCRTLLTYCKEDLQAQRVYARMYDENIGSKRVCSICGMTPIETIQLGDDRQRTTMRITF